MPFGLILGQRADRPIGDFMVLRVVKGQDLSMMYWRQVEREITYHKAITGFGGEPIYSAVWWQETKLPEWE